eukprot:14359-Eustigmatos_ZCMA.PRE.1
MSRAHVLFLLEAHLRHNTVMLPCAQKGHDLQHVFKQVCGVPGAISTDGGMNRSRLREFVG